MLYQRIPVCIYSLYKDINFDDTYLGTNIRGSLNFRGKFDIPIPTTLEGSGRFFPNLGRGPRVLLAEAL